MPIQPFIPSQGLAGWKFLQTTLDKQVETFNKSPDLQLDLDYFNENAGDVETLDDLMGDRRLLTVALGAFGLGEEINKGAYVRKILEEGTESRTSFANRLGNTDYLAFAKNFAVDSEGKMSISDDLKTLVSEAYQERRFEVEVGNIDNSLRLSLNFKREIQAYAGQGVSEKAGWFRVLGSVPMRTVVEGAFNLPSEFSALDVDKQVEILTDKAQQKFGTKSIDAFLDPNNVEDTINQYLLREQISNGPSGSTPGSTALALLGGGTSGLGSSGLFNLLLSNT